MIVKKAAGKVFGAELTAAERKAMNMEIQRQLAEYTKKHQREIDAMILWELHIQYGWGETRLRRFYDALGAGVDALVKRYEMDDSDDVWLCTQMLKQQGIDLDEWDRERSGTLEH